MAEPPAQNSGQRSRRWTVIGSGVLCALLALVVIYTKPGAFRSPMAVVVLAAIGLAALLLQIALYNRQNRVPLRAPKWLNLVGVLCAIAALFGDVLRLRPQFAHAMAFGAIGAFSISGAMIMHNLRKRRIAPKGSGSD